MQQSQYTCDYSKGRWCGGCGERDQQQRERERREEETQYLTHSHMNHFAACVYRCGMQVEEDMGWWWW